MSNRNGILTENKEEYHFFSLINSFLEKIIRSRREDVCKTSLNELIFRSIKNFADLKCIEKIY